MSYHLFTKQNNLMKLQGFNEPGHVKVLLKCYGLWVCAEALVCLELLVGSALAAGGSQAWDRVPTWLPRMSVASFPTG